MAQQQSDLRQILIVEFKTPELMAAYEGVPQNQEGMDKVEVIFTVNPLLEEDEKIIQPWGWYEIEYINQLREQLNTMTA